MLRCIATLVGSALYAITIALTGILAIPGADNVQFRPGVAIPILVGVFFGPVAGFVVGAVGTLIADLALGWGWWPFWYIGSGCMGLASGLWQRNVGPYLRLSSVFSVVVRASIGIVIGMGFASFTEYWVTQSSWHDIVWVNFVPAALSNLVTATLLVPIILLLYGHLHNATRLDPVDTHA
jgi:energy-coupling factor transport system substrate-specific component